MKQPIIKQTRINPTTLLPLTQDELQPLQKEFDALNGSAIRTRLNQYGFTGKDDDTSLHPYPGIKFTKNKALQMAVTCLLKNKKFTNTADSQDLLSNIHHIQLLETDSTAWKIVFGPQSYNGLKIPHSLIPVYLYGDGVYELSGFWYSNIYIPPIDNFTINHAKANIIGKSITYYGDDGKPIEFIIAQNSILEPIEKAIYALDKQNSIELRVYGKYLLERMILQHGTCILIRQLVKL